MPCAALPASPAALLSRGAHATLTGGPLPALLQAGVAASQKNRWLEIPLSEPLGASLQGKWLVEFPTLHVAAPGEEGRFPVASSAEPEAPPPENRWL